MLNALEYPYGIWSYEKPKNFDYYFTNKRNFRVSRNHYPQYEKGNYFGYYEDLDYWDNLSFIENREIDNEIERAF